MDAFEAMRPLDSSMQLIVGIVELPSPGREARSNLVHDKSLTSNHVMAAIDVNDLAGNEATGVAGEQRAGRGNFVDLAEARQRNLAQDLVAGLMHIL